MESQEQIIILPCMANKAVIRTETVKKLVAAQLSATTSEAVRVTSGVSATFVLCEEEESCR